MIWNGLEGKILITVHTGFKDAWLHKTLSDVRAEVTGFALEPETQSNLFSLAQISRKINFEIGDVRNLEHLA